MPKELTIEQARDLQPGDKLIVISVCRDWKIKEGDVVTVVSSLCCDLYNRSDHIYVTTPKHGEDDPDRGGIPYCVKRFAPYFGREIQWMKIMLQQGDA